VARGSWLVWTVSLCASFFIQLSVGIIHHAGGLGKGLENGATGEVTSP